MDFQKMFDAISTAGREARKPYHLSLGALRDLCAKHPDALVVVDESGGLGDEHSYRGYYHDIAFSPLAGPTNAADVLAACERGLSLTYQGYKGGDYQYDYDTPAWFACHGNTGPAIVAGEYKDGVIQLTTRETD